MLILCHCWNIWLAVPVLWNNWKSKTATVFVPFQFIHSNWIVLVLVHSKFLFHGLLHFHHITEISKIKPDDSYYGLYQLHSTTLNFIGPTGLSNTNAMRVYFIKKTNHYWSCFQSEGDNGVYVFKVVKPDIILKSHVATRGFGGLNSPNKAPSPHQIKTSNTINQWSFSIFRTPSRPLIEGFWRRFWFWNIFYMCSYTCARVIQA